MSTTEMPAPVSTGTQKRKLSTKDAQENQSRPTKRRASKACACCRARKVRCNVVENGVPCTNCRLDGVECVLMESRRRRSAKYCSITRAKDTDEYRRPQASVNAATDAAAEATEKDKEESLIQQEDDESSSVNDHLFGVELGHSISPQEDAPTSLHRSDTHIPHLICKAI